MVHDSFSSQSEGDQDFPQAFEIAEQMGTPPTRSRSIGGRRERFVVQDVSANRGQKRDRRTQKTDRQKGRLDARYHKELDTTLQVLGIDGDIPKPLAPVRITTSVHVPLVDDTPIAARRSGSVASSSVFFSPRAGFGRTPSEAGLSEFSLEGEHTGERPGLQERKGSLPPRHPGSLTPVSPPDRQFSLRDSLGPRESGALDLGDGAIHRLQSERQEWHADLDSLLEGNFASEDLDLAITLAKNKANDLKEQLSWWARPPEADWPTREQRLEWLEHALGEAQDIMRAMQSNGALDADLGTYVEIVRVVLKDLRGMGCMISEAVAEGLRSLEPAHHDTKRGFRAANKALHLVLDLTKMLRHTSRLDPGAGLELDCTDLGACAQEIVLATLQATATLQDSLLFPGALAPGSINSGHELQVKARMLQHCWDSCGKLIDFVAHFWPEKRGSLYCEWCKLFLKAATAAEGMQEALRQYPSDNLGMDSLGIDEAPCPGAGGVWGVSSRARFSAKSSGTVSDEDLQAQAWLPSCLRSLLAEAEKAADAVLSWESASEYEGGASSSVEDVNNSSPKGSGAACIIVEALSESMYDLAHTGAQRVAKLCREPSGLACWALELLEEQACMAVLFVRDLDRGLLGRGSHGLQQYEMLRRGTDALVNGILRVRRLLKQKRTADADDTPVGAPLKPAPSNASTSSLSSGVTSLSATSAARQPASRASFSSLPDPPLAAEQLMAEDAASRPVTPATPTRKAEASLSAALASSQDVQAAGPAAAEVQPGSTAPQAAPSRPPAGGSAGSAAIPIPRSTSSSALPAHSTWGKASKAAPARAAAAQPGASGDRARLQQFAAGRPQPPRAGSPASKDGSTTDSSLKGASRDASFVFVGPQGSAQLASSPEQLPQIGQPAAAAAPTPASRTGKPSPAAQHASFRRWASHLDNSPTAQQAEAQAEPKGADADRTSSGDDVTAEKFLDAMLAPPAAPGAGMPSAAAVLANPMPKLAPLPSPFDTEELQRSSRASLTAAAQPAGAPRDSAFLGFPKESAAQPAHGASMPAQAGPSSSYGRTDHERHPGKDRRHSKWKNFGRGGSSAVSAEQDPGQEDCPPSRSPGMTSSRGRDSRSSRGQREEDPNSRYQPMPEPMDRSASGQTERSASGKPGLLRRFKDALRRPTSGSSSRMERTESRMDRQEPVLVANGSGMPTQPPPGAVYGYPVQQQPQLGMVYGAPPQQPPMVCDEAQQPTDKGHKYSSRSHHGRSSRHSRHVRHEQPAFAPDPDQGSEGGRRRHRRRSRRHSSRAPRPEPRAHPAREHQSSRRRTEGAPAQALAPLVMPWEGDPFWQIKWEDIKPALVRKVGSGGFAQVYEVYMYGALMAVKIVNLTADKDLNLSEALIRFKDEVDLQRRLSLHPNVVRFMGACCHIPHTGRPFQDDTLDNFPDVTLAILMELCQYGTLYDVMNQARRVKHINQDIRSGRLPVNYLQNSELKSRPGYKLLCSWRLRLDLALQAAAALQYTHEHGVIHRDLTSTNLLVTNKWECKLSDFGLSRAIEGANLPNSGQLNSLEWMAPERLVGEEYGTAADVFSFGVVLWELLTLEQPWFNDHERPGLCSRVMPEVHGMNQLFVIRQVPLGVRLPTPTAQDVEPPLPDLPKVCGIVEDCWKGAADQRPSMKQVFERLKVIVDDLKSRETEKKSAHR